MVKLGRKLEIKHQSIGFSLYFVILYDLSALFCVHSKILS